MIPMPEFAAPVCPNHEPAVVVNGSVSTLVLLVSTMSAPVAGSHCKFALVSGAGGRLVIGMLAHETLAA
jgi:hypothetical protein